MQRQIQLLARAKINLAIDVLEKRQDGFHEVEMIMQSIDLADEITVTCDEANETSINITTKGFEIPTDQRNIMWKAVELLLVKSNSKAKVHINITKNIPTQAGLGGGSADGAAVLLAVKKLLNLSFSQEELMRFGAELGSDIPFMFNGGTALATGRGEKITPILSASPMWVVLIKPDFGISTAKAYQKIGQVRIIHPDVMAMREQIVQRKPLNHITAFAGNVIEQAVRADYPIIDEMKHALTTQGASLAMLSGSGSTVFGLFDQQEKAIRTREQMVRQYDYWCQVVQSSHKGIEIR